MTRDDGEKDVFVQEADHHPDTLINCKRVTLTYSMADRLA